MPGTILTRHATIEALKHCMRHRLYRALLSTVIIATSGYHALAFSDSLRCGREYEITARGSRELYGIDSLQQLVVTPTPFAHEPADIVRSRLSARFDVAIPSRIPDVATDETRTARLTSYDVATSTINPPDNTMAINRQGLIVCAINSRVMIFDTNGVRRVDRSLDAFFNGTLSTPSLSRFLCDPRVVYDEYARRFIITAMTCEGRSSTSQILLAVSKTENPLDGWWAYDIRPSQLSPNATSLWFDFPQVTTTATDVFITASLFDDSAGYDRSFVLELVKAPLLEGRQPSNVDRTVYLQLPGDPYAMYPVPGRGEASQNRAILISNGIGSSDQSTLTVFEFETSSTAPTRVTRTQVDVPTFRAPGFTPQPSSNILLSCFDQRGASAIMMSNRIHYVYTISGQGGRSAIMYVVLTKVGNMWRRSSSSVITRPAVSLAYPSIAPMQSTSDASDIVLSYTFAGANDNPGIGCVILDSMLRATPEVVVRRGDGPVDFQSLYEYGRWADYTTTVTDVSSSVPGVWTFAPYGNRFRSWNNLLTRVRLSDHTTRVDSDTQHSTAILLEVLSQPIEDDVVTLRYSIANPQRVTVNIISLDGYEYAPIIDGISDAGTSTIQRSISNLPAGVYLATLRTEHTTKACTFVKH